MYFCTLGREIVWMTDGCRSAEKNVALSCQEVKCPGVRAQFCQRASKTSSYYCGKRCGRVFSSCAYIFVWKAHIIFNIASVEIADRVGVATYREMGGIKVEIKYTFEWFTCLPSQFGGYESGSNITRVHMHPNELPAIAVVSLVHAIPWTCVHIFVREAC